MNTVVLETDIEQAVTGDREAFARVYDAYAKQVYGFVYTKTQHTHTAEDITSQVFMKALEHIQTFRKEKASFSTWLFTIARRTIIDYYRTKKTEYTIDDAWDIPSDSDIPRDIDTVLHFAEVAKIMKGLSPAERDLITLRIWQGLSFAEIADIIGKSPAACKVGYGRAIQKIRQALPHGFVAFYLCFLTSSL
jgi:RNA polymerase sigma-70 factor (ECF subfamily)